MPDQVAVIFHAMVMPKQVREKCTLGQHCSICIKQEEEGIEVWNGNRQKDQPQNHCPQNIQHPQSYDVPHRYLEQIILRREWDEKMECLNEKYNLDYYSSLEDKYETLI